MSKEAVRKEMRAMEDQALRKKAETKKGEKKEESSEAPASGKTSFSDLLGSIQKLNKRTEELKRKNAARLGLAQPADGANHEDEDDFVNRLTDEPAAKPTGVKPASEPHATPRPARPRSNDSGRESINAMYARYMDSKDEDIRELGDQIFNLQEVVRASECQVSALRAVVSDLVNTVRAQEKEISTLKQEQQAAAQAIQEMMEVIKKAVG
ncbi:hypothetical protein IKE72_02395 [Candidatus Saccharibacteria bacterium]|nr:hypothetical protein [Candidatus Saccharibacteria bacterium]